MEDSLSAGQTLCVENRALERHCGRSNWKSVRSWVLTEVRRLPAGGAISNMYAMLLARYKMFPEVKEKGMSSVPKLAAFTSEHVRAPLPRLRPFLLFLFFTFLTEAFLLVCRSVS